MLYQIDVGEQSDQLYFYAMRGDMWFPYEGAKWFLKFANHEKRNLIVIETGTDAPALNLIQYDSLIEMLVKAMPTKTEFNNPVT